MELGVKQKAKRGKRKNFEEGRSKTRALPATASYVLCLFAGP